jgi:hypothetical protein
MVLSGPDEQILLMAVFGLLAANVVAAAIFSWLVSTRRRSSPVREWSQRRLLQRVARLEQNEPFSSAAHP